MQDIFGTMDTDEVLREIRSLIRDFERNVRGDLTLAFYIGSRDRLVRLTGDADFTADGDDVQFEFSLDMGGELWDLTVGFYERNWRTGDMEWVEGRITWSFFDIGGSYTHEIRIYDEGELEVILSSDWNRSTGRFTLSMRETGRMEQSISGNFQLQGSDDFILEFSPPVWGGSLDITISTSPDVNIGRVDFVNIDRWGEEFLDNLDDLLWDLGW